LIYDEYRARLEFVGAEASATHVLIEPERREDMGSLWRRNLEFYKGMIVGCAPGTHTSAVEIITKHLKLKAGVLDCGARSGALLARLRDAGFDDLNAIDLDVSELKLKDVPIRRIDLNTRFSALYDRKFNLVCCSDVLEHLDSPRNFFQQAYRLLADDGFLCITVPNIAFWHGRLKFAIKGEHWGFGERNYRLQRHISPMTFDAMRMTMAECGFRLVDSTTGGDFSGPLRKIVLAPVAGLFRLIGGPRALGETSIYLAQKAPPAVELTKPEHYTSWDRETMPVEKVDQTELAAHAG
jgi:SAM-dependent methyltransferase